MAQARVDRKKIEFMWEDREAQAAFRDWVGFPGVEHTTFVLAYNHTLGFMADDELGEHLQRIRRTTKPSGSFLLSTGRPQVGPGANEGTNEGQGREERPVHSQREDDRRCWFPP